MRVTACVSLRACHWVGWHCVGAIARQMAQHKGGKWECVECKPDAKYPKPSSIEAKAQAAPKAAAKSAAGAQPSRALPPGMPPTRNMVIPGTLPATTSGTAATRPATYIKGSARWVRKHFR